MSDDQQTGAGTEVPAPAGPPEQEYLGGLGAAGATSGSGSGADSSGGGDFAAVLSALSVVSTEVGETRAHLTELRDHFGESLAELGELSGRIDKLSALAAQVAILSDRVKALTESGGGTGEDLDARPVDLAHIDPDDLPDVLGGLVAWVREVVFVGWPWTQQSLRGCWLQHPDLINAMLWLRTAYRAAYDDENARPHAAADWHRWLDDVMTTAERRTRGCPHPAQDKPHAVPLPPRDDLPELEHLTRRDVLAEIHRLNLRRQPGAGYPAAAVEDAQQRILALMDRHGVNHDDYNQYLYALRETEEALADAAKRDGKEHGNQR
ncbi:hypothetical protein ABT299_44870 [Spirillospora sp. NPDC000708]